MTKLNQASGFENPLQNVFPQPVISNRAPTGSDRNYPLGQVWVRKDTSELFGLGKVEDGQAYWTLMSPGASDVQSLTPDSGTSPVSPLNGTIDVIGGDLITVTGSPNTLTINSKPNGYPITPYVVGNSSEAGYLTIQSAIDAAVGSSAPASAIWVQPGTYFENLDFSGAAALGIGLTLIGTCASGNEGQVEIAGTHIPPLTGTLVLRNFKLTGAGALFSSVDVGSAHIVVFDSEFNVMNGYAFDLLNWNGILEFFHINPGMLDDGFLNNTGGASLYAYSCGIGSGSLNTMQVSGPVVIGDADVNCPINFSTGSEINAANIRCAQPVTFSGDAQGILSFAQFAGGSASAIIMNSTNNISLPQSIIESTDTFAIAGTGAGQLDITSGCFLSQTAVAATLTLSGGSVVSPIFSTLSLTESLQIEENRISAQGSAGNNSLVLVPQGTGKCEISSGNVSIVGSGNTLEVKGGDPTDFIGEATLAAGIVTINNTNILATDKIFLTYTGSGLTNTGALSSSIVASTSFSIHSTNVADANVVSYFIVRQI